MELNLEILEKALSNGHKQARQCDREIAAHQRTILAFQAEIDTLESEIKIRRQQIANVRQEIVEQTGEKMANLKTIALIEKLMRGEDITAEE